MKQITIHTLPADARSFNAPFEDDYALLLVVASDSVSDDQRDQIAADVVRSRCQYALTFGHHCKAWHDAVDSACLDDGVPKDRFLMTTWHDDEPIEDVIDFLWWNTFYEDFEAEHLAVALIGSDPALEGAIRSEWPTIKNDKPNKPEHRTPDPPRVQSVMTIQPSTRSLHRLPRPAKAPHSARSLEPDDRGRLEAQPGDRAGNPSGSDRSPPE